MHLEIEAIGEDSRAYHESVWAVIALIKRALLLAGEKKGLDNERAWGALLCASGLVSVKRMSFVGPMVL